MVLWESKKKSRCTSVVKEFESKYHAQTVPFPVCIWNVW